MRSYNYRTRAAERHTSDGRFSAKRFTSADRIDFNLDGTTLGRMDIKSSELNIRLLLQSDARASSSEYSTSIYFKFIEDVPKRLERSSH